MSEREDAAEGTAAESLSQFLARVLGQLTISAWLPAMTIVAIVLVVAQLAHHDGSISAAFSSIGDMDLPDIVLLIAAVVVTTVFTQAFEFEAIRALEGYWRLTGLVGFIARWRRRHHVQDRAALRHELVTTAVNALGSARIAMRNAGHGSGVFDVLEELVAYAPEVVDASSTDRAAASKLVTTWKQWGDSDLVRKHEFVEERLAEYPNLDHRVLPTRLGNIIRAAEEKLHDPTAGRLETYPLHFIDQLPASLRRAYRDQRKRLDLYCGLVFSFGAAVVPTAVVSLLSFDDHRTTAAIVTATFAALAVVSYRAAVATAKAFGLALIAIKEHLRRQPVGAPPRA